MPDHNSTTPVIDPQDPLPEANWLWRRVFIFGVTTATLYLVYGAVDRLGTIAVIRPEIGIAAFVSIVKLLVFTVNIMAMFYIVAPSAEQITKMVKTASLLKSGVQLFSQASVRTPQRSEDTKASVGIPPAVETPAPATQAPGEPESLPDAPWAAVPPPAKPQR